MSKRTAKPCGPDASVVGVKFAEGSRPDRARMSRFSAGDGGEKSPILRGERDISRKAIAQGECEHEKSIEINAMRWLCSSLCHKLLPIRRRKKILSRMKSCGEVWRFIAGRCDAGLSSRELGRAALLVGGGVRRSQQVEDARMKQILMVFAAVLVSSTFALADTPVTPAESEKIELALEAFGCTGGKTERRLRGAATLKSMTPSARTTRIQFPFAFSLR